MITQGAHHISLSVTDLEAARAFYGALLGLPEIERPDFGFPGTWYQAGAVQLHLIQCPPDMNLGSPPETLNPIGNHLAFAIEDPDAVKRKLDEAGIESIGPLGAMRQIFARDPHGNIIEFNPMPVS